MKYERIPPSDLLTADDRLRWLVRFALMHLDGLRLGDWLNLQEDMVRFLQSSEARASSEISLPQKFGIIADLPKTLSTFQEAMREVQPTIHRILDTVAVDLDAHGAIDVNCFTRIEAIPLLEGEFVFSPGFRGVRGTFKAVLLWHVQNLIMDSPFEKVVHCRECRTIFYRVRQQEYCSRTCVNRVQQRRLRKRRAAATAAS
jgi:hypothetical protein